MARYYEGEALRKAICSGCNKEFSDAPCEPSGCLLLREIQNLPTADVAPKSEVARLIEDLQRSIRADAKVGMSAGEILLHINNMLAELKKKYTEEWK